MKEGFRRDDLFTCVHEQFMTDTAKLADVVLPATMFLEHDDIYKGGGNQHITLGPKLIDPPAGPRTNHYRHRGARQAAWRRRQAGLRHDRARAYRGDADQEGTGRVRRLQGAALGRSAAGIRQGAFHFRLRPCRRQISLPPRLDGAGRAKQAAEKHGTVRARGPAAGVSRSCRPDRGGGCGASVPAGDLPGTVLPQFVLHRDAKLDQARRPARNC